MGPSQAGSMLKHTSLAILLLGLAFSQTYTIERHLDDTGFLPGSKVKCIREVPKDFACAIFFDVDPPLPEEGIDIASVVTGKSVFVRIPAPAVVRGISVILDGTFYTAVYDPPLKRDDKFSRLGRNVGIPTQVSGDDLFVIWPDGTEAKGKIVWREKINPNRPQPA